MRLKLDDRPPLAGWAPGSYAVRCVGCRQMFFGDKRATQCADCAHQLEHKSEEKKNDQFDRGCE